MKSFFPYVALLRPYKLQFFAALFFGAVAGIASGFGGPYATKYLIPYLYMEPPASGPELAYAVATLPIIFLLRALGTYFNIYSMTYCGLKILEELRTRVFTKLQQLHCSYFESNRSGDLLSRTMNDTQLLQETVIRVGNDLIIQPITLFGALGYLTWISLQKSEAGFIILYLLIVPVFVFPIRFVGRKLHRRAQLVQQEIGGVTEFVRENIAAHREVRAFNLKNRQIERFNTLIGRFLFQQLKVIKYLKMISPSIEFMSSVGIGITIYYARITGVMVEDILSVIFALYFSYDPVKKIGVISGEMKRGSAAIERIEEILHTPVEILNRPDATFPEKVRGDIKFSGVRFSYGEEPILQDINCGLEAGKVYALVGPSGAGKSTFANLIPRFYDVTSGAVSIDGTDLKNLLLENLRNAIAIVPQDPVLFNDTIFENIQLSQPDSNPEDVYNAARQAFAHDFISEFPDGYQTIVGDRGTRLSGGQKQRIALARAFLKNAPILILDEATSSLDAESEEKIHFALENLIREKTVVLIAHRFSSIRLADEVLVFNGGRIVASGPHEQILKENKLYRDLYEKQMLDG